MFLSWFAQLLFPLQSSIKKQSCVQCLLFPLYSVQLDNVNTMKRFFRKSKQDVSITEEEATLDTILKYSNIFLYLFCFICTSWINYILLKNYAFHICLYIAMRKGVNIKKHMFNDVRFFPKDFFPSGNFQRVFSQMCTFPSCNF